MQTRPHPNRRKLNSSISRLIFTKTSFILARRRMARQLYQKLCLVFCYHVSWIALTKGDKEIILKEPKRSEHWLWQSDAPWTTTGLPPVYSKCTIGSPDRFYIRTPFIPLPPSVRTIEVSMTYAIKKCSSVSSDVCSETFDLYKYEQNDSSSKVTPKLFKDKVKTVRAGPGKLTNGNPGDAINRSKDVITVTSKSAGVYLAIFDVSVCQALFSFEVSYRICSRTGANLVEFEKRPVPANGSLSRIAQGTCVNNSILSPSASASQAVCNSNGEWIVDSNLTCFCDAGYQPSATLDQCIECPLSTFKAGSGNEQCNKCSANTSPNESRTGCECNENFFRNPGETNCTEIPSAPVNISTNFVNESAVSLSWQEPTNTGGREDIVYDIKCEVRRVQDRWIACSEVAYKPTSGGLKQKSVTLSNLWPSMRYKFTVVAKNGVSHLEKEKPDAKSSKEVTTDESKCQSPTLKARMGIDGVCECIDNFFRNPGETNCTAIPSAPVNMSTNFVNDSAVSLIWQEPTNTGGREDIVYDVKCEVRFLQDRWTACLEVAYNPTSGGLKQKSITLSNLRPFVRYRFTVVAKNGVSHLEKEKPDAKSSKEVTTDESIPGKVDKIIVSWLNSETVNIQWTLNRNQRNGKILYYEVRYYQEGSTGTVQVINSTDTNSTISGLSSGKAYVFEVQAKTKVGFGAALAVTQSPYTPPTVALSKNSDSLPIIVGASAAFVFVFLIICCAVLYLRRKSASPYVSRMEERIEILPTSTSRTYVDPGEYGDLFAALKNFAREIERELLTLEKVIGGGEFGDVYQGQLKLDEAKSETVAIKMLKPGATRKSRDDFLTEASIMGQFKHDNVLKMEGVISTSSPMMIVLEFMENGALNNFLKQHDGELKTLELLGMAQDVAKGMSYLSDMNFIHRDLSARNILVSDSRVCKVADFGLSREVADDDPNSEYLTQGGKIPVRWTAIEAFKYRKFSSASDVWSYGVLMWEIMSFGERPYWQWDNYQVMSNVERGYKLPAPMDCPKVIHTIMLECWREDRTRRPKFDDLVQLLEQLISSPNLLSDEMADQVNCKRRTVNFEEIHNVDEWLEEINLEVYKPNFNEAGLINLGHVIDIDDTVLKVIGVDLVGHRNKIKKSVKTMKDFLNENAEEGEI